MIAQGERAAMLLADISGYRQTQPGTAAFPRPRRFDPVKRGKYFFQFLFRHPRSAVANPDHGRLVQFVVDGDIGILTVFERIVDQVIDTTQQGLRLRLDAQLPLTGDAPFEP